MINISIDQGKHSISVPKGTEQQIGDFLRQFGLEGEYCGRLGKKIRGSGHKKGEVRPLRLKGHAITLAVQPGDNSTRFEVHVYMDGRNAEAIFAQMRERLKEENSQVDKLATATGDCKTENIIPVATKAKEYNSADSEKGEAMLKEEKSKPWFAVKKILQDMETVQLILLVLTEKQEQKDGREMLQIGTGVKSLQESGLIGMNYKEKAVARLFPMLTRLGYLAATEKRGYYLITQEAKRLLNVARPAEQKLLVANSTDDEMAKRTLVRVDLVTQYTVIESELLKLKDKYDELETQRKKLAAEIMAELK